MHIRIPIALAIVATLTAWSDRAPSWPHAGPMPDEAIDVPSSTYAPVGQGTKSYRPVEPMPWSEINKRVAPPAEPKPTQPAAPNSGEAR